MRRKIQIRPLLRLGRDQRGSELMEFAVASTLFMMAVFGFIEFGMAMYANHFVSYAAQMGARYAIVRGSTVSTPCSSTVIYNCQAAASDIQTYVQGLTPPGLSAASVTVTPTWLSTTPTGAACTAHKAGCEVKVQVGYPFSFPMPFLPSTVTTLTGSSVKVIQQ